MVDFSLSNQSDGAQSRLSLAEGGLFLGKALLFRSTKAVSDEDADRLIALLTIAFRRGVSNDVLRHVEAAFAPTHSPMHLPPTGSRGSMPTRHSPSLGSPMSRPAQYISLPRRRRRSSNAAPTGGSSWRQPTRYSMSAIPCTWRWRATSRRPSRHFTATPGFPRTRLLDGLIAAEAGAIPVLALPAGT